MSDHELTILVTIRGRRHTLPRLMNYYKHFPAKVIYVDSTPGLPTIFLDYVEPHTYRHVPGVDYIQKLSDCLEEVDTEYCIIACDDDFLTRKSAEYGPKFLKQNKDCVAVWGQEITLRDEDLVAETYDYLAKYIPPSDKPDTRVLSHWRNFNGGIVHTICRTGALREVINFHKENKDLDAIKYFDKTFAFCLAALGNIGCLPICHMVRSHEESSPSLLAIPEFPTLTNHWKPELSFAKDFINHDLSPLAEMIGVDIPWVEERHHELCSGAYRREFDMEIMQLHPTRVDDKRSSPEDHYKIAGRTMYAAYGPGANFDGTDGYYQASAVLANPADLYPSFDPGSHEDLISVMYYVDNYNLSDIMSQMGKEYGKRNE